MGLRQNTNNHRDIVASFERCLDEMILKCMHFDLAEVYLFMDYDFATVHWIRVDGPRW